MDDPTVGSWYVGSKVLSHTSVVVIGTLVVQPCWVVVVVG
jgi:hypothetical protein